METSFSGNFLALMGSGTVPKRFSLRSALDCFLDFRFETMRRKAAFQLSKVSARAHIVDGLLQALISVDEVIQLVRDAPDQNAAKEALMDVKNKKLGLSIEQAEAVLKLQLGQLTRLNKGKLTDEKKTLEESKMKLEELLNNDTSVRTAMTTEFQELKDKFAIPRRSAIEHGEGDLEDMDLVENSKSVVVVTSGGYIKRMPLETFENQKRGTRGKQGTSASKSSKGSSKDDKIAHCFTCNDHDTLLMTTSRGIAYGLRAFQVPTGSRTAKGVPIPSVLPVKSDDLVTSILPVVEFSEDEYIVVATKQGWIKKTPLKAFEKLTLRGLTIASLSGGDELSWCQKCVDGDDILIGTSHGMATRFESSALRPTGRTSRGVKSMKLKPGDTLADVNILAKDASSEHVLVVSANGYGKRVKTNEFTARARGGVGVISTKFKPYSSDYVSCLRVVNEDDEILVITSKGVIVRQKASQISIQSRAATGVLVQKVDIANGDFISSVSIVPTYAGEED